MSSADRRSQAGSPPPSTEPQLVFIGAGRRLDVVESHSPAIRLVRPPTAVRRVALALAGLFPLLVGALLLIPWQQTALGTGRVIALSPVDRSQAVEAPVKGRIAEWRVSEGEAVEEGDVLVYLEDNDPDYAGRLADQRRQVEASLEAARQQVQTYRLKVGAETTARDLAVAEYEAKILSEHQKLSGESAEHDTARLQTQRVRVLTEEGIESTRKLELTRLKEAKALAAVEARRQVIAGLQRARDKAAQAGDSKVASAEAAYQGAVGKEAESRSKLLEVDTKLARQSRQVVVAPRAGRVLRVHGGIGGAQVKPGDPLVTLVPDTLERAVELKVDGNDMPLITEGELVSLLFEGWPALQFSGWPELNTGAYRGVVAFTDATDDGSGQFRVVVTPDETGDPWPSGDQLRQGVRTKGFVMLARVRLGYELWRQINGFPALPTASDDSGSGGLPATSKKPRASKVLK